METSRDEDTSINRKPFCVVHRADILAVLVGVEFFLPCITSPSSSPHSLTALTSSCLSLVHTLSVVTSPLSHLHTSLSSTPPLLLTPTHSSSALCHSWMEYLDLTHFGILATSNQNTDDLIRNFQNFLSLPYPSWNLLLKVSLIRINHEHIHNTQGAPLIKTLK